LARSALLRRWKRQIRSLQSPGRSLSCASLHLCSASPLLRD
jgi:hypothetical protein